MKVVSFYVLSFGFFVMTKCITMTFLLLVSSSVFVKAFTLPFVRVTEFCFLLKAFL